MKKFYYLFTAMLLSIVCMGLNAQNTVSFKVTVDDAERVGVQVYSYSTYMLEDQEVVTGDNTYTVTQYAQVRIYAKTGNLLATVKDETGGYNVMSSYGADYSTYPSMDCHYSVTSVSEEAVYTSSFPLTVDDPSKVSVRMYSGRSITLNAGENTVKYDPVTEPQVTISPMGGAPLYKVTDGGVDLTPMGTSYYVTLSETTNLDVKSVWPEDAKFDLSFNFTDENTKDMLTGVTVNGVPVEDFANGAQVQGGGQVTLSFNVQDYAIDAFTVNGSSAYVYGNQYNFYITENTTIGITAHKLVPINFTVNIDDPSNITLYKGYTYENNSVALVAGDNAIQMASNSNKCITVVPNTGCFVTSINDGTQEYTVYSSGTTVNVAEGMTITIKTGKVVRDKTANVTVTGRDLADSYFNFYSASDYTYKFDFSEGSNTLEFCDNDLPFTFGVYGSTIGSSAKVYVNGLLAHASPYEMYFDNGANIQIDLNGTNESLEHKVDFVLGENIESYNINKVVLPIGPANEWSSKGLVSINGESYQVTITPSYGQNLAIVVDGVAVDANAEGNFVATVTPETTAIYVYDAATVGISDVNAASEASGQIFTISGVKVDKAVKGLYIKNGKKYIAR